jgi:ribose/xylose/arabinose/galactoside ABC-type transport system permease subunit
VTAVPAAARVVAMRRGRLLLAHPDVTAIATLALAVVVFSVSGSGFATSTNLKNILIDVSLTAIMACGQNLVILAREIDVSVGSMLAVALFVGGKVAEHTSSLPLTLLAAVGVGAAAGAVNGFLVARTPVPSIVVTLGTLYAFRGAALLIANNRNIDSESVPASTTGLGSGSLVLGIPNPVLVALGTFLAVTLVRRNTNWGRDVIATGANRRAAETMGVPVRKIVFITFVISGLLAGLGAVVYLGEHGGAFTSVASSGFELQVIAACAIGGTSIRGGRGTDLAPVIGALLIGVIANGIVILGVPGVWITCAYGACIIVAVARDRISIRPGAVARGA